MREIYTRASVGCPGRASRLQPKIIAVYFLEEAGRGDRNLRACRWSAGRKDARSVFRNNSNGSTCWVLDELGYVPFSKAGAQLLFDVVGRAYEHQSLMITTNLPFKEWTEVFGSERLTGALLDRLTHRCHIIEVNGESCRLRQAKKRAKGL